MWEARIVALQAACPINLCITDFEVLFQWEKDSIKNNYFMYV